MMAEWASQADVLRDLDMLTSFSPNHRNETVVAVAVPGCYGRGMRPSRENLRPPRSWEDGESQRPPRSWEDSQMASLVPMGRATSMSQYRGRGRARVLRDNQLTGRLIGEDSELPKVYADIAALHHIDNIPEAYYETPPPSQTPSPQSETPSRIPSPPKSSQSPRNSLQPYQKLDSSSSSSSTSTSTIKPKPPCLSDRVPASFSTLQVNDKISAPVEVLPSAHCKRSQSPNTEHLNGTSISNGNGDIHIPYSSSQTTLHCSFSSSDDNDFDDNNDDETDNFYKEISDHRRQKPMLNDFIVHALDLPDKKFTKPRAGQVVMNDNEYVENGTGLPMSFEAISKSILKVVEERPLKVENGNSVVTDPEDVLCIRTFDIIGFSTDVTMEMLYNYLQVFGKIYGSEYFVKNDCATMRLRMQESNIEWVISLLHNQDSPLGDTTRTLLVEYTD